MSIETFTLNIEVPDTPAFWAQLEAEAARIDVQNQGSPQHGGYTRRQALLVCFHEDGFETIARAVKATDERASSAALGWHFTDDVGWV